MSNSNREVALAWFEQAWNAGDESAIDRLMAPSAKFHGLPIADAPPIIGPAAFKPLFREFRQAFPDLNIQLLRIVCEGDLVASHCLVSGTHTGAGPGPSVQATGLPIRFFGMAFAVVQNGQIQEGWNCFDFSSMYQQLGVAPPTS